MSVKVNCGLDFASASDSKIQIPYAVDNGYDFVSLPLVNRKYEKDLLNNTANIVFQNSDFLIPNDDDKHMIIGRVSDCYNMDSEDETYRKISEDSFMREIKYATYLSLYAVIFKLDAKPKPNLARFIYSYIKENSNRNSTYIWAHVPMVAPKHVSHVHNHDIIMPPTDTWHWWHNFQQMCDSENSLGVALELPENFPSHEEVMRWFGEPLEIIIIPTSLFLTDNDGLPILPSAHQDFIRNCAIFNMRLLVTGNCRHESIDLYLKYLDHIYVTTSTEPDMPFANNYELQLTLPLQPLVQNLDSYTYEEFEKDTIKYTQYENAIYQALMDRAPMDQVANIIQVIMVVGAGRGPIVNAALNAAQKSGRPIKCIAIEKNPNAVLTLLSLKRDMWGDLVEVVGGDVRFWESETKCDILVSELLGSFGDNELSPECLSGAQRLMKDDGVCIPCQYTSFLCPIQSSKLRNNIKPVTFYSKPPTAKYETPYVIPQHMAYAISKIKPLFTFDHPNKAPVIDNSRYNIVSFYVEQDSVLHGFNGYFEAVLYKEIKIGIVPTRDANGTFSWSPLFFPIKIPLNLKKGDELKVHFWRRCSKTSVWYEWSITKPAITSVHNSNGECYEIGLC